MWRSCSNWSAFCRALAAWRASSPTTRRSRSPKARTSALFTVRRPYTRSPSTSGTFMNERMPSGPVMRLEMRCSASASLQTNGRRPASAPPTTPSPTLKTIRLMVSSAKPRVATGTTSPRRSTARTALL